MLLEILARSLGYEIGTYRHFAGSMHMYNDDVADAEKYVGEGVQARIEMPEMPMGDPWPNRKKVQHERMINMIVATLS